MIKLVCWLLTNYFSFIPYPYKLGLIRTLVDRSYTINNAWLGVLEDIKKVTEIHKRIFFQPIWFKGCQSVPHAHP